MNGVLRTPIAIFFWKCFHYANEMCLFSQKHNICSKVHHYVLFSMLHPVEGALLWRSHDKSAWQVRLNRICWPHSKFVQSFVRNLRDEINLHDPKICGKICWVQQKESGKNTFCVKLIPTCISFFSPFCAKFASSTNPSFIVGSFFYDVIFPALKICISITSIFFLLPRNFYKRALTGSFTLSSLVI